MGITRQKLIVKQAHQSRRKAVIEFLIDSGPTYSVVSAATLKKLGIRAYRELDFSLAGGTLITRRLGDAYFELDGHGGAAPVVFGEKGDAALLGATTLEAMGFVLDPFKRRLEPARMLFM